MEYTNGDPSTVGGAMRAARGRVAPYNVTYWYLGNEISQQSRYPAYPANLSGSPPPDATEYRAMLKRLVPKLLAASPTLPLRLLTVATDSEAWNQAWIAAAGPHVYATSSHTGYMDQPRPFSPEAVTACARRPRSGWLQQLRALRAQLDRHSPAHTIAISADEWGLGPPWAVRTFSVAHAMYAAGLLGAAIREAAHTNLQMTNYFEPVNEGAIRVEPLASRLTPVGQARSFAITPCLSHRARPHHLPWNDTVAPHPSHAPSLSGPVRAPSHPSHATVSWTRAE